jgi:inner membrane protein
VLVVPYVETQQGKRLDAFGKPIERASAKPGAGCSSRRRWRWTARCCPDAQPRPAPRARVRAAFAPAGQLRRAAAAGPERRARIGTPYLSFSIADVRGLVGTPDAARRRRRCACARATAAIAAAAACTRCCAGAGRARLRLDLRFASNAGGTESLQVVPLGDSNRIALRSSWPHPQFAAASCRASATSARTASAPPGTSPRWPRRRRRSTRRAEDAALETLQLGLVDPVNVYTQADRASKYGVLFVLLTFVGFFMFELLKQLPIHPIQYGLVGLALAIFFLLLLSLSEHMEFWIAYLLRRGACIGLLGTYLSAVLQQPRARLGLRRRADAALRRALRPAGVRGQRAGARLADVVRDPRGDHAGDAPHRLVRARPRRRRCPAQEAEMERLRKRLRCWLRWRRCGAARVARCCWSSTSAAPAGERPAGADWPRTPPRAWRRRRPESVLPRGAEVDIARSLAPFVVVYDAAGAPWRSRQAARRRAEAARRRARASRCAGRASPELAAGSRRAPGAGGGAGARGRRLRRRRALAARSRARKRQVQDSCAAVGLRPARLPCWRCCAAPAFLTTI